MNSTDTNRVAEGREQKAVGQMFNRISRRYDIANRILSFGIDQRWRKQTIQSLGNLNNEVLLDVATGTGDMIWMAKKLFPHVKTIGLDYSPQMLDLARKRDVQNQSTWIEGTADELPLDENSISAITITFGIRNVAKYQIALTEFFRVLKPKGKLAILEFSIPTNPLWKRVYLFYFRHILPVIGGWISGDKDAYRYLPNSVERFPYGESFVRILQEAGFSSVQCKALTGGIASLYTAQKQ